MKERPILFSAPMVRAILDGRKTQTRRMVKDASWPFDRPQMTAPGRATFLWMDHPNPYDRAEDRICPYGQPGDRLWVRETFYCDHVDYPSAQLDEMKSMLFFRADVSSGRWRDADYWAEPTGSHWRPSIHMPRWASRITLEVTSVRVERLQDIDWRGALAEGVNGLVEVGQPDAPDGTIGEVLLGRFRKLWDGINGAGAWDANPFAWVVEFKRVGASTVLAPVQHEEVR